MLAEISLNVEGRGTEVRGQPRFSTSKFRGLASSSIAQTQPTSVWSSSIQRNTESLGRSGWTILLMRSPWLENSVFSWQISARSNTARFHRRMMTSLTSAALPGRRLAIRVKRHAKALSLKGERFPAWVRLIYLNHFLFGVSIFRTTAWKVVARVKTGLLIGAPFDNGKTVGGSAPNFLAAQNGFCSSRTEQRSDRTNRSVKGRNCSQRTTHSVAARSRLAIRN